MPRKPRFYLPGVPVHACSVATAGNPSSLNPVIIRRIYAGCRQGPSATTAPFMLMC